MSNYIEKRNENGMVTWCKFDEMNEGNGVVEYSEISIRYSERYPWIPLQKVIKCHYTPSYPENYLDEGYDIVFLRECTYIVSSCTDEKERLLDDNGNSIAVIIRDKDGVIIDLIEDHSTEDANIGFMETEYVQKFCYGMFIEQKIIDGSRADHENALYNPSIETFFQDRRCRMSEEICLWNSHYEEEYYMELPIGNSDC